MADRTFSGIYTAPSNGFTASRPSSPIFLGLANERAGPPGSPTCAYAVGLYAQDDWKAARRLP